MAKDMNEKDNKGKMSVQEAGERGGNATKETHDRRFYEEIGREGGHSRGKSRESGRDEDKRAA